MDGDDFLDDMMEGGDELMNSELCPHCGNAFYLDQEFEWIDEMKKIAKCPHCGGKVEIAK